MSFRNVAIVLACFLAGAAVMIGIRGAGSSHRLAGHEATGTAPTTEHDGHAEGTAATPQHADHGAPESPPLAQPATPPSSPPAEVAGDDATAPQRALVYVCAQDAGYGLSYAGNCPLDGQPMVQREVDLSAYRDLENATCPVMGGASQADVFALYKDKRVRFCCPGCGETFFSDPEGHLRKLGH